MFQDFVHMGMEDRQMYRDQKRISCLSEQGTLRGQKATATAKEFPWGMKNMFCS